MRKLSLGLSLIMLLSLASCGSSDSSSQYSSSSIVESKTAVESKADSQAQTEELKYTQYAKMSADEIVKKLNIEQKAAQMVQPAVYSVSLQQMKDNCYGSILSKLDASDYKGWQSTVDGFQKSAVESESGIPYLYGQDDVHGVNYCSGAVIFPHNIGIGAANDEELTYQMGLATADEAKLCHMLWTFSPCVAQSQDPRWGRTYESYGSDLDMISKLGSSYTKGLIDGGIVACAKHFFADGNVEYGTGEKSDVDRIMDRGDATLTDDEINNLLKVYQAEIDAGVQTIMVTHSSVNGVKMHENSKYIQYLKNDMGFKGFVVSDWNSIQNTSAKTYDEQVVNCVNAGIDMLMEVDDFETVKQIIINAVSDGRISEDRVNDAVQRIIQVKLDEGIFDDPMCENLKTTQTQTGSDEYRQLAEKLVEESLVLLKNDNDTLPLKEGSSVYITGPAANSGSAQCGGWTIDWNESPTEQIEGVTTILDGFKAKAEDYGINVITDEKDADKADVVLLCVGEKAYAEWNGDTSDLQLCGALGLSDNQKAIDSVKKLDKPTIACVVAGRQVIINDYENDWDSIVMCYLPGSEGQGVADVLCGDSDFKGRLPSNWYSSVDQIGTDKCEYEKGYGLSYEK